MFLFCVFQTIGLKYTSVSNTAIYTGASALLTPILSWLILKKNINKKDIVAAVILILSIAILNKFNFTNANIGDMFVLTSGLFLSLQVIYISKVSNSENTISITIIMLFTTAFLGLLSAISTNTLTALTTVYSVKEVFLYLGIFTTALAFLVQNNAVRYTSESQISLILSTEAIWGVIFGVIIFNDALNLNIIIAVLLMAYALYLSVK